MEQTTFLKAENLKNINTNTTMEQTTLKCL